MELLESGKYGALDQATGTGRLGDGDLELYYFGGFVFIILP